MAELNESQKSAVEHFNGPCLVVGTPGSGKTRVITERIKYLVINRNVRPENILVITFTKAAAMEMRKRYRSSMGQRAGRVQFGTFHAIFFMILKMECGSRYKAENIIRDDVKRNILRVFVQNLNIEIQDENEFINDIENEISKVKGELIDINNYYSPNCDTESFRNIYKAYGDELEKRRLIDFDDMVVDCYKLLSQRPDILDRWHRQYPYILIDEFQDINRVQYDIMKLLAAPENNIFIVGDDDQSIYGFRGAKPDIMKYFLKDFKGTKQYVLGINYRCNSPIVEAADRVISNNRNRLEKRLEAFNIAKNSIEIRKFSKLKQENDEICSKILEYRNKGIPYSEMAVLFRTNTQARALTSKLMEYNIPFVMKERIPNIYEHWIARDIFSYINAALGDRRRQTILRIINRPKRYVHRNALEDEYVDFEELKLFYEDKYWMIEKIEQLESDLKMLSTLKPYTAMNFIRCVIGYNDYIKEYADYRGIRVDDMENILDELQEDAKSQNSFKEWFEYIEKYTEELKEQSLKSRAMLNGEDRDEDAVIVLTMHGAKGLEYECVFIPDANEGITPHNKAVLDADVEEERRMFYVAMTRAKKNLHIFYVEERFNREMDVSRFVDEIEVQQKENNRYSKKTNFVQKIFSNNSSHLSRQVNGTYRYGQPNIRYKRPDK